MPQVFQATVISWLLSVMNMLWIAMKTFGVSTNSYRISVPILFVIILSYFGHKWPSWLLSFVLNHGLGEFIELYTYLWLWSWCTMQGCFEVGILLRRTDRYPTWIHMKIAMFYSGVWGCRYPLHYVLMSHAEEVTSCVHRSNQFQLFVI